MKFKVNALPATGADDALRQSREAVEAMSDQQLVIQQIACAGAMSALHMLMTIGCNPDSLMSLKRGQQIMSGEIDRVMKARRLAQPDATHPAPESRQ